MKQMLFCRSNYYEKLKRDKLSGKRKKVLFVYYGTDNKVLCGFDEKVLASKKKGD